MLSLSFLRSSASQSCVRRLSQISRVSAQQGSQINPTVVFWNHVQTPPQQEDLCQLLQSVHLKEKAPVPKEYKLPTSVHIGYEKTILDPLRCNVKYELPTFSSTILEKFTPSVAQIVPIDDPSPLQKIIDQGNSIEKQAMPWLLRVRHKKMKKHKLKKFRKRNKFMLKRLLDAKRRKREAQMVAYEKKMAKFAKEFDPEVYIAERINQAKRGGWGINILDSSKNHQQQSPN